MKHWLSMSFLCKLNADILISRQPKVAALANWCKPLRSFSRWQQDCSRGLANWLVGTVSTRPFAGCQGRCHLSYTSASQPHSGWETNHFPWVQRRAFGRKSGKSKEKSGHLTNEQLVSAIMKNHPSKTPDGVEVRLVTEKNEEGKMVSSSDLVSLSTAIQVAVDRELDLIAVALQTDIPVIKAASFAGVVYHEKKKQSSSKNTLERKEFSFKVAIAENDLMRQIGRINDFLEKGHPCLIRARCPRYMAENDEETLPTFMQKLLGLLEDASPTSKLDYNEAKTHGKVVVQKKTKKK